MTTKLLFRRAMMMLLMLLSVCGVGIAHATNCQVKGSVSITLSPCPLTKTFKYGTASPVAIRVITSGALPNPYYVLLSQSAQVVQPNTFRLAGTSNNFQILFSTYTEIPSGKHAVALDVKLCGDSKCNNVLVDAGLPSTFDSVVPPNLTRLSPASVTLGAKAFMLKAIGGGFTRDCKIHFGTTVLSTTFVSVFELIAKVNLSTVTKGRAYEVTVVPATGIASQAQRFTLNNLVPTVTAISPTSFTVGLIPGSFLITVTGTGFITGSKVKIGDTVWSGTTTFVSSTEVTATVSLPNGSSIGGTYDVSVVNPTPGGGASAPIALTVVNNVPTITSLSPSTTTAGSGSTLSFFINGTGLQSNSTVTIGGVSYAPTGYSPSQLVLAIPAGTLNTAGSMAVTVTNPAPGGGTSNTAMLEVDNPLPAVAWISPVQAYAGSGDMVLTVRGSNLNSATQVEWNGTPLPNPAFTGSSAGQFIQVTVPQDDLVTPGIATIRLFNPSPGGGAQHTTFPVMTHPPDIDSLSPGFTVPGGGDFTLTLDGQEFDPSATVYWNDDALSTSWLSATELQATVPAAEIAAPGVAKLTVVNPAATGGASLPASFAVDASGSSILMLSQPVNDIEWDPGHFVLYGTTHALDPTHPHALLSIDPVSTSVTASTNIFGSIEGRQLSLSGDDGKLYIALPAPWGVLRFGLPGLTSEAELLLGSTYATATLQASPVYSHVVAVNLFTALSPFNQGAMVLDDTTALSYSSPDETWDAVAWSADGRNLYAGDVQDIPKSFMTGTYSLTAAGTQPFQPTGNLWAGGPMHVDAASGLVYADNSATVIDPAGPSVIGTFPVSGVMIPDSTLGCAYFITQTQAQIDAAAGDWTLSCYSTTDQTLTRSIVIPAVNGTPTKMLRWGNEGLAFITDGGYIYFVSGQVVTGN